MKREENEKLSEFNKYIGLLEFDGWKFIDYISQYSNDEYHGYSSFESILYLYMTDWNHTLSIYRKCQKILKKYTTPDSICLKRLLEKAIEKKDGQKELVEASLQVLEYINQ